MRSLVRFKNPKPTLAPATVKITVGFCSAFVLLNEVLGDINLDSVIAELIAILRGQVPCPDGAFQTVLQKIFNEWARTNAERAPGEFLVAESQVLYSTKRGANRQDKNRRDFQVAIKPSFNGNEVVMIWQVSSQEIGRNTFSIATSDGQTWRADMEMVSEAGHKDLVGLAKTGAEIIGWLVQNGIFKAGSTLAKANEAHTKALEALREQD